MPNRGTPFDWYFEDEPSRQRRDDYAIGEGLGDLGPDERCHKCFCSELSYAGEICSACSHKPKTESEKILAARKKHPKPVQEKPSVVWPWTVGGSWYSTNSRKVDGSATACNGQPHLWKDTYVWKPIEGYTNYRTKAEGSHHMIRKRCMVCIECGEEVVMRSGFWYKERTRPMEAWELAEFEKVLAKRDRWKTQSVPKDYGKHPDGSSITREEHKRAQPKRRTRKRED